MSPQRAQKPKFEPGEAGRIWRGETTEQMQFSDAAEAGDGNGISGVCFDEMYLEN